MLELEIPLSVDEPYLSGAALFGILAFPPTAPNNRDHQLAADALAQDHVLRSLTASPELKRTPCVITPAIFMIPPTRKQRFDKEIPKRLNNRMAAAHAVIPFFQEAERIALGGSAEKRRRKSVDHEAERVIGAEFARAQWLADQNLRVDRQFPDDANNFDNRLIRPSLPVLHIAVAVALVMDMAERQLHSAPKNVQENYPRDMTGIQIALRDFLEEPKLVELAVLQSLSLQRLLPYLLRPKISVTKIVKLGWPT